MINDKKRFKPVSKNEKRKKNRAIKFGPPKTFETPENVTDENVTDENVEKVQDDINLSKEFSVENEHVQLENDEIDNQECVIMSIAILIFDWKSC